ERLYQRTVTLARRVGSPGVEAWAAYLVAVVRCERGDADGARSAVAEALPLCGADNDPRVLPRLLALQSWLAALEGDDRMAREFEEQGLALAEALDDQTALAFGHLVAARCALDRDERPAAAGHLWTVL